MSQTAELDLIDRINKLAVVMAYDPQTHVFLTEDGCIAFGFLCSPKPGSQDKDLTTVRTLLNWRWPKNTLLGFQYHVTPDIHSRMLDYELIREGITNPFLQANAQNRKAFLLSRLKKEAIRHTGIHVNDQRVLITVKMPQADPAQPSPKELEFAAERVKATRAILEDLNCAPWHLDHRGYLRMMSILLDRTENPTWQESTVTPYDASMFLKDQVGDYDASIRFDEDGAHFSNGEVLKSFSAKRFPDELFFGGAREYIADFMRGDSGIREQGFLTLMVHYGDTESDRNALEANANVANYRANLPLARFTPALAKQKDAYDILFKALTDGDVPIKAFFNIAIYAQEERAAAAATKLQSYFRGKRFQMLEDRGIVRPILQHLMPFNGSHKAIKGLERYRVMATTHAAALAPIFGDGKGSKTPTVMLVSRSGQLMGMDNFDTSAAFNGLVTGRSGGGKTVMLQEILMSGMECGHKAYVIEMGYSMARTCRSVGGQHIDFTPETNININPFHGISNWEESGPIVKGMFMAMAFNNERPRDIQEAALGEVLKNVWEQRGQDAEVSHVAEALKRSSDQRVHDIGSQLSPFCESGEHGRFFSGGGRVDFTNDFVVCEMEGLKQTPHLARVLLYKLMTTVGEDMAYKNKGRRSIFAIDEAWSLIQAGGGGGGGGFDPSSAIQALFRTARKHAGSVILATQNVLDIMNSPARDAVISNTPNLWILQQESSVIEDLAKDNLLGFDHKSMYDILKTVHTVDGAYAEMLVKGDQSMSVGRLILPPENRLVYSSRSEDRAAIEAYEKQGMGPFEAARRIMQDRGLVE